MGAVVSACFHSTPTKSKFVEVSCICDLYESRDQCLNYVRAFFHLDFLVPPGEYIVVCKAYILSVHMRVLCVFARIGSLSLADIPILATSFGLSAGSGTTLIRTEESVQCCTVARGEWLGMGKVFHVGVPMARERSVSEICDILRLC